MNTTSSSSSPAAEEQAALWAARLDGSSLSATDREALEIWLNSHASHRPLLSHYCQFSTDLEEQLLALLASGGVTLPPEEAPARRRWRLSWIAPVVLAAAAAVVFAFWPAGPATQRQSVATAVAQRQSLTLADGTRVELNAHTSLQVDLGAAGRHVRLAGGEAFFSVTKDPARPFVVETPAGSVRVTGTAFNVRAETAAALVVTVVEGSVQVRPGDTAGGHGAAPAALGPSEHLTASAGRVSVEPLSATALEDALAWRRGQIVFRGTPLREALARFARYHGRDITLSPAADAAGFPVGGVFGLDDLKGFLTSLDGPFPIKVREGLSGTVHVSLQSEP